VGGGLNRHNFYDVISIENLLMAWQEFRKGKRSKPDIAKFEINLESNLFELYYLLFSKKWEPDPYKIFFKNDPKLRKIHEASIRDRVLFQAVYQKLYHIFDPGFIFHSYSSRNHKGTYAGIVMLEKYINKISRNHTRHTYILKCDIRKFFDSIDHNILFDLMSKKIKDNNLLFLIKQIISSFETLPCKGLPLGNVTSQLFSNIYLNELDQYVKHILKVKCYVRYCDDFVIVSDSLKYLNEWVDNLKKFCKEKLFIEIHPNKISFQKSHQGVDFLGYVVLPHRRVLRTKTKNRLLKKISDLNISFEKGIVKKEYLEQVVQSYLGILSHCKGENVIQQIERIFWD